MISRNLQCHCSSKLRFSSFHSLSAHFCFAKKKSSRNLELLSRRPLLYCGSCWPLGGYRPTDVARNSSSADRWSEMVRSWGAGGALLLYCSAALLLLLPPSPAAGGRLREFWWHNGNGATLQCRSKRAHAEAGGDWGTCEQPEQDQQLPPQCMLPDQKCVFETQQENYLSLNGDRFSCYLD